MHDRQRRAIPAHESQVSKLIARSRREDALRDRSRRHESAHTSLFTPLALSQQLRVYSRTRVAGPPPPRSWAYPANTSPASGVSSPGALPDSKWRARALRWILMHIDHPDLIPHAILRMHVEEEYRTDESVIPTLREMCVQSLILPAHGAGSHQPTLHDRALDSDLPAHLRKFIVRYFAIHFPLPWSALGELWGIPYGEQGAGGEVILVGESAGGSKISSSAIKDILTPSEPDFDTRSGDTEEISWDADEFTSAPPLKTLISVAHPLLKHISSLPPTIAHLALIAIPLDQDITPRGLMAKLSSRLRLLEVLDLSCNSWLVIDALDALDWSKKWLRLRFIALINCPKLSDRDAVSNIINSKRNWEKVIHIDFA